MFIGVLVLISLFVIITIFFLRFFRSKNSFKLGAIFGLIHLLLVGIITILIYTNLSKDGESVMAFLLFYLPDMPMSLLIPVLTNLFKNTVGYNFMVVNFYIPAAVFAVLGSIQYFFIGTGISLLFKKITKK